MMMIMTKMIVMMVLRSMAEFDGAVARVGGSHVVECGGDVEKLAVARVERAAGVVRRREYKYS